MTPEMFATSVTDDFSLHLIIIISSVLCVSAMFYAWFVYMPYAAFPACRLELRILNWLFKGVPFSYAVMQTFIEESKRYESEGVFAVWIGVPALVVYGEDIIKKIVQEHAASVKPRCYKLLDFAIKDCIALSNGEMFKKQLKMAAPAFQVSALKSYTDIMNRNSRELVERLEGLEGRPTDDVINIVGVFAVKTIFESNLGDKEIDTEECKHIMKVLKLLTDFLVERQWSPWLYPEISLKLFPSARAVHRSISNLLEESLKSRLEKIKESIISREASPHASDSDHELNRGRRFKSFGETFVEQHLRDPTVTMDDVIRQVAFITGAGFDTVVHTLEFAFCLLGIHQDVQDRAFDEVMSETDEGHVTYEDTQRLTYLECVIKETLRLYPTVPVFARSLTKDLQCGKYKLPRNSTLAIFPYMLHRDPETYPDPEKFDPERFLGSRIRPWHFIPFAEGFRPCLGANFAMIEMKILLSHVLRNFRIVSLDRIEESDLSWSVILFCTKKTLRMQFVPRT